MNKKIFILLFFVLVLISMSAVSAVDVDDNNDTFVSSDNMGGALSIANGVDTIDNLNENDADGDGKALENDAKPVAVGKNNGNELLSAGNDENENILTAAPKTYYVNSSAASGGTGTETAPFQTLNAAFNKAENGDTIMIAAGEYKGTDNTGLQIQRNLNFVKYGDGEAIFDAEGQRRIWTVMDRYVNIIGLTFKNGNSTSNGGAIYMRGGNVINCTFIDNTASTESTSYGGAIYCLYYTNVTNCNFTGNYARYMGGAFYTMRGGNVSNCIFTGNTANWWGGAIRLETVDNTKGTVTNCAFVNNSAQNGKVISSSRVLESIDNNWWGSNDPDWNELINKGGIPSSYAVLNGSADSETIKPGSKAKLTYGFYSNATGDLLSIPSRPIELSATGGHLDDDTGYLVNGEFSTEFSSDALGEFEITATVDNQEVKLTETVAATVWYVNATAAPGGDGKSQATPFQTLKEALDVAEDYDTIMIAAGTYTGTNNTGLDINKKLSFEKYGDGEAILDAQQQNGIFTVNSATININGLTFKNGKRTGNTITGGAIYFGNALSDSIINATFIDNTVVGGNNLGGAIYFDNKVDNVKIFGEFINNTADLSQNSYGGAIAFHGAVSNSIINATFIDNSANWYGGAVYSENTVKNVEIYGEFKNNKVTRRTSYGGAIALRNTVSNSIINATFINNTAAGYAGAISFTINLYIENVEIYGKFINNRAGYYGGAIYSSNSISNSIIDATFINNTAEDGGANMLMKSLTNVNITSDFINNTATGNDRESGGGANYFNDVLTNVVMSGNFIGNSADPASDGGGVNYFYKNVNNLYLTGNFTNNKASNGANFFLKGVYNSIIDAAFINNTASGIGVALCFNDTLENTDITGKFINNTGDSVIHIKSAETYDDSIHDSIFINNNASKIINIGSGEVKAFYNWFGNNATNYDEAPDVGIDLKDWLFLNATADSTEIGIGENSKITFKLSSYNRNEVSNYNGPIDIKLDLNQTLGELDKTAASLGEEITYTAMDVGDASVTATFETASYTIKLKNSGIPTALNLYMICPGEYNPSFTVDIGGTVKNKMTGVTIKKGSVKLYLNGENVKNVTVDGDDGSISYSFEVLDAGNYTVKAVYHDDTGEFLDCEWNSSFEIKQAPTGITINNTSIELIIGNGTIIEAVLNPSEAGNLNYSSNDTSVAVVNKNGEITAVGAGTANITVSFEGNNNYAASQNYTVVTVSKIPAEINITQPSIEADIGGTGQITGAELIPSEAGNLTYSSNDTNVVWVSSNGDFTTYSAGTALITVSFAGNENYTAAESKTITFTVNKWPTNITLKNETFDLKVYDEVPSGAALDPSYAGELNYTSSDESVVKVENCNIKAVGVGQATVTVSFGGARDYEAAENKTIAVTVSFADARVDAEDMELTVDENGTIKYYTTPVDLNVTFVPDNSGVVGVDENGTVTALKGGIATITVKVGGDGIYAENSTTVTVTVSKIATEIIIQNVTADMKVTDEVYPVVSIMPSGAGELDFTSSDVSVVTVNGIGTITAVGEGVANVTVRFMGNDKYAAAESKNITVTVSLKDASVSVNNSTLDLQIDENFTIVATTVPGDLNVTYITDNSGVYSVDENGVVTALKEGTASIIVQIVGEGVYAENSTVVTVTVSKIPTEITIANATLDVKVLNLTSAGAALNPAEAGNLSYNSSNSSVAMVFGGVIVPVGQGNAIITVSFNGTDKYAAAENKTIIVNVSLNEVSVSVENSTLDLKVGDTYAINATTVPAIAKLLNITYTSSDESVVTVDENGTVTATGEGNAIITVSVGDGRIFDKNSTDVFVTVSKVDISDKIVIDGSAVIYGENATVTVGLPDDATGNVAVTINDKPYTAKVNGNVTVIEIPGLASGLYESLNVTYSGDIKYYGASGVATIVVDPASSSVEIMPIEDITYPENNMTIEYLVENATTVTISVFDGKFSLIANKTTIANVAEFKDLFTVDGLSVGDYYVFVYNEGTANYIYSYDHSKFAVNKAEPVMETSISENIIAGDVGVAIHVVLPENATGRLMVAIDGESINQMGYVLINGTADINIPPDFLILGRHSYMVGYNGDDNYSAVFSYDSFSVAGQTPLILVDCPFSAFAGDDVNVTVNIENATGVVELYLDDNLIDVGDLDENSTISFVVEDILAGSHYFTVVYSGDEIFYDDFMNLGITVLKEFPVISVDCPVFAIVGDDVNVTVHVENATGFVKLYFDDNFVDMGILDENGTATIVVEDIVAGNHYFTVEYSGDGKFYYDYMNFAIIVDKKVSEINISAPVDFKLGEAANVTVDIPGSSGSVSVIYDGVETIMSLDENGTAVYTIPAMVAGDHSVVVIYGGDDTHAAAYNATQISVKVTPTKFENITIFGDLNITAVLVDDKGSPIANAVIEYAVGNVTGSTVTGADGSFVIAGANDALITIDYAGKGTLLAANATLKLEDVATPTPALISTQFNFTSVLMIKGYAVDTKAGEKGFEFITILSDVNGNPLANKTVQLAVNSKVYDQVTNESGKVHYYFNMVRAGRYTMTYVFLGDGTYNSTLSSACVDLEQKPITIKASAKTYKASQKTKSYTVTISTIVGSSADGKVHLSPKKISLRVNGKTYTGKTNDKGQVTFKITNLNKAGKYTAKISYDGDATYQAASKSVRLTIKK